MEEKKTTTKKAEEVKLNLYQKINEVKKVVKTFTKDKETEGYGSYSYISGTQILSAIKDKMEELQLLLLPVSTEHQNTDIFNYKNAKGQDKTDFIVQGKIIYEWIDAENPQDRQSVDWQYYGQQNDISKAFGSGLTYSERYILLKSLGVPTDDEDPDAHTEDKAQQKGDSKVASAKNGSKQAAKESNYKIVLEMIKDSDITMAQVNERIKKKYQKNIRVNELNEEQFKELTDALKKALEGNGNE